MNIRKSTLLILTLGGSIMAIFAAPGASESAGNMYTKTPSGTIEIKMIPESRILVTETYGSYFDNSNQLFGRLFNYIKEHDIPMTARVFGQAVDVEINLELTVVVQTTKSIVQDGGHAMLPCQSDDRTDIGNVEHGVGR